MFSIFLASEPCLCSGNQEHWENHARLKTCLSDFRWNPAFKKIDWVNIRVQLSLDVVNIKEQGQRRYVLHSLSSTFRVNVFINNYCSNQSWFQPSLRWKEITFVVFSFNYFCWHSQALIWSLHVIQCKDLVSRLLYWLSGVCPVTKTNLKS